MGHSGYLDKAYKRISQKELARLYLKAIPNVSIYSVPASRREEVRSKLAMTGLTFKDVADAIGLEMYEGGEGSGGGMGRKLPIDEDYIASLEDAEIGKYALKALRQKLLGESESNVGVPRQKIVKEDELESYLADVWR